MSRFKHLSTTFRDRPCCHFFLLRLSKTALIPCLFLATSLVLFAAFATFFLYPSATSTAANRLATLSSLSPSVAVPSCHFNDSDTGPTRPKHILFGLSGSAKTWKERSHYAKLWWDTKSTRGFVWLDEDPAHGNSTTLPANSFPPYQVSATIVRADAPWPASDRIARILKESFELGVKDVRWFVMGDDDTVFFVENLVSVLSRYDHREMYYVGGISESVEQDVMHGYSMAFGGGGFAVSYPLACELVRVLDGCIDRYRNFYGSDQKVAACVGEFGIPLTREAGFHQLDIKGDPYGLLAAHPVAPLVSLHHLDYIKPLFPGQTQVESLKKLIQAYKLDPGLTVQQSFCYDHRHNWSVSISWGYAAQLYPYLISTRELRVPLQTFLTWRSNSNGPFVFETRPQISGLCEKPIIYFLDQVLDIGENKTLSIYKRSTADETEGKCILSAYESAMSVDRITVTAYKTGPEKWMKAPRRQCCDIMSGWFGKSNMRVKIRNCNPNEATIM